MLTARSSELSERSQKELGSLLEPLRERLQDFQAKVETTYQSETREVLSLKEQIRLLSRRVTPSAAKPTVLPRRWRPIAAARPVGEIALERILETAGLVEGREYVSQGRGLGLRNEDGGLQPGSHRAAAGAAHDDHRLEIAPARLRTATACMEEEAEQVPPPPSSCAT